MAHDEVLATVIRERLLLRQAIDDAAELSFMESAGFRLNFFGIVGRFDGGAADVTETLKALGELRKRVAAVASSDA